MPDRFKANPHWLNPNTILAEVEKCQTDRQYRESHGVFYVEGVRNFVRLVDAHLAIVVILYSERLLTAPLARKLVRRLRQSGIHTIRVSPEAYRKISRTEHASGIGAIVRQKWTPLHTTSPSEGLCWVVFEHVRSPGNLGTLVRTSEAVGGAGFILLDRRVDPFDPVTIRATMGAIFHQRFIRTSIQTLRNWIRKHRAQIIGASPDGLLALHQFAFPKPTLLFLGEERKGLTQQQREICDHLVRIPMVGTADSLNLGVAGSLLMYEVYRSRMGILCTPTADPNN